jgi:hypothetical protein
MSITAAEALKMIISRQKPTSEAMKIHGPLVMYGHPGSSA